MGDSNSNEEDLIPVENSVPVWVMPLVTAVVILFDGILAFLSFALAFMYREGEGLLDVDLGLNTPFAPYAAIALLAVPVRILALWYYGSYSFKGVFTYATELLTVTKATFLASMILIAFTFLYRGGFEFREFSYSRGIFILDLFIALLLFSVFHLFLRFVQTRFRRLQINLVPTLVVGDGEEADETIKMLESNRDYGYKVVGRVPTSGNPGTVDGIPNVGNLETLASTIKRLGAQEVIITDSKIPKSVLFETLMRSGRSRKVEFRLTPSLFNYIPQKTSIGQIGVLPMITLFREPLSDAERILKRISDIAFSTAVIVVLSPLLAFIAIAVKVTSKGSVFFLQERVGMDGRTFTFIKFRSMIADADDSAHREVYVANIKNESEESEAFGKVPNDPRITPVGRILRRFSLDELPQFFNVIRGDMSVVGPRPPIPYEVEEYELWHRKRLDMKPGITGLWQVSGRNRLTFEEMVRLDLYYIENWSLFLDLKILILTLPAILRGEGEK